MAKPLAKLLSMLTPERRWAPFSLATLFVAVTALCVWLGAVVNRAHRQRDAVAAIEVLGGRVEYAGRSVVYEEPDEELDQEASEALPKPFQRRWLPRDYFDSLRLVDLRGTQDPDAGLAHLHGLTGLQVLYLDRPALAHAGAWRVDFPTPARFDKDRAGYVNTRENSTNGNRRGDRQGDRES